MIRVIGICLAWVLATTLLAALLICLDLELNFFFWSPEWKAGVIGTFTGIGVMIVVLCYLAQITKHRISFVVALLAAAGLLGLGLIGAQPEPIGTGWLARTEPSPAWYRWGRVGVCALPLLSLGYTMWRSFTRIVNVQTKAQTAHALEGKDRPR